LACDGATTNKSAWKFLGISGENGNVINKIVNPVDESRNVYFFSDIPHIIKCVRNHLHKQGEAKFSGKRVSWGFYRALYDTDKTRDLRLAPKLTYLHINPGPFQKMVVSHAVQ
ncbi:Transposable element P transposase, partial [Orchesella cincta]